MASVALSVFTDIVTAAIPFAVVFSIGNLIVTTFMRAAFGGKLVFGGGK